MEEEALRSLLYEISARSEVAPHRGQNVTVKRVADGGFKAAE
jgi:hypothetical protein